nr:hypothetical protein [Tanacetum cinerariifolium]
MHLRILSALKKDIDIKKVTSKTPIINEENLGDLKNEEQQINSGMLTFAHLLLTDAGEGGCWNELHELTGTDRYYPKLNVTWRKDDEASKHCGLTPLVN